MPIDPPRDFLKKSTNFISLEHLRFIAKLGRKYREFTFIPIHVQSPLTFEGALHVSCAEGEVMIVPPISIWDEVHVMSALALRSIFYFDFHMWPPLF